MGHTQVVRGGGWGDLPRFVRVADRSDFTPTIRTSDFGFRCVATLKSPE